MNLKTLFEQLSHSESFGVNLRDKGLVALSSVTVVAGDLGQNAGNLALLYRKTPEDPYADRDGSGRFPSYNRYEGDFELEGVKDCFHLWDDVLIHQVPVKGRVWVTVNDTRQRLWAEATTYYVYAVVPLARG